LAAAALVATAYLQAAVALIWKAGLAPCHWVVVLLLLMVLMAAVVALAVQQGVWSLPSPLPAPPVAVTLLLLLLAPAAQHHNGWWWTVMPCVSGLPPAARWTLPLLQQAVGTTLQQQQQGWTLIALVTRRLHVGHVLYSSISSSILSSRNNSRTLCQLWQLLHLTVCGSSSSSSSVGPTPVECLPLSPRPQQQQHSAWAPWWLLIQAALSSWPLPLLLLPPS
jgi:hypothetical protein